MAESDIIIRGLRIHQGRMKCGRMSSQHNRTASAVQTEGTQSWVANYSAAGPNSVKTATVVEAGGEEEATRESETGTAFSEDTEPETKFKYPKRLCKIKWPKANIQDEHLSGVLQHTLRGMAERKIAIMENIIYEECRERFEEYTVEKFSESTEREKYQVAHIRQTSSEEKVEEIPTRRKGRS